MKFSLTDEMLIRNSLKEDWKFIEKLDLSSLPESFVINMILECLEQSESVYDEKYIGKYIRDSRVVDKLTGTIRKDGKPAKQRTTAIARNFNTIAKIPQDLEDYNSYICNLIYNEASNYFALDEKVQNDPEVLRAFLTSKNLLDLEWYTPLEDEIMLKEFKQLLNSNKDFRQRFKKLCEYRLSYQSGSMGWEQCLNLLIPNYKQIKEKTLKSKTDAKAEGLKNEGSVGTSL